MELQRGRFASQFREVANSGVEISHENEMHREEDQSIEMGTGAHVERGSISNDELL